MSELRTDWLTGRTVILAEHRAERPNEFAAAELVARPLVAAAPCPFCPGQESITPPAVYTKVDGDGRWLVRVVPNKFPVVAIDEPAAAGAHEVIIESPRHVDRVAAISIAEFADVFDAYRERLAYWHASGRFQYGLVFKNLGAKAVLRWLTCTANSSLCRSCPSQSRLSSIGPGSRGASTAPARIAD